ncbi:MAG: hypothetical protein HZB13_21975 [Acidobacteria bacterium]|nr:hypothetical protein [Acidobacteriota bacterium]
MRRSGAGVLLCAAICTSLYAQRWEAGGLGAFAMQPDAHVSKAGGEASVKFRSSAALGAFAGHNMYRLVGGEVRYMWRFGNGEISSGAVKHEFGAHQQLVTYDILVHTAPRERKVRPYVAAGGGVKWVTGTGNPAAFPPLMSFGAFTAGTEAVPVADAAFGVKVKTGGKGMARIEVRDVMSAMPSTVFTAAPGAKLSGWMHDVMVVAGLGWTW